MNRWLFLHGPPLASGVSEPFTEKQIEPVTMKFSIPARDSILVAAIKIAAVYLVLNGVFYAAVAYFSGGAPGARFAGRSGSIDGITGIISITAMSLLVLAWRSKNMLLNLLYCFVISSAVASLDFMIAREAFWFLYPEVEVDFSVAANASAIFMCMATYFGWSCLFLTLLFSFDVREQERRLAAVREEALSAQMRALRYQVNPHFLFNTLNSIAGLIEEGSATRAEKMLLSLSTFLRTTLTLDPFNDVPLADELALQEEYLAIEHQRFSDRMDFHIDISPETGSALVPSLILQPLVENAIKHGVGQMTGKTSITLMAKCESGRLKLSVENDMPPDAVSGRIPGMGIGLKNVAERIRARFGDDGHFSAGISRPGLYRATLDIPWSVA